MWSETSLVEGITTHSASSHDNSYATLNVAYTVRFCVHVFIIHQSGALAGSLCVPGANILVMTSQFNEQLQRALNFCSFEPEQFKYIFHIGTATTAAAQGTWD